MWPAIKLGALIHDASEAYLIDVPPPVKVQLENYGEIEERLLYTTVEKFGFKWPLHEAIKAADNMALENERECLIFSRGTMDVWDQQFAKAKFLEVYHSYDNVAIPNE